MHGKSQHQGYKAIPRELGRGDCTARMDKVKVVSVQPTGYGKTVPPNVCLAARPCFTRNLTRPLLNMLLMYSIGLLFEPCATHARYKQ